jgi:hypothetical protein
VGLAARKWRVLGSARIKKFVDSVNNNDYEEFRISFGSLL